MSDPATLRQSLASGAATELEGIDGEWAAVMALLDRQAVLHVAAHVIPQRIGVDFGFAAERIDDLDTLEVRAASGNLSEAFSGLAVPAGIGLSGKVAVLRHPISVGDYFRDTAITHEFDSYWREEGLTSGLAVPIIRGHRFHGVLCAASRTPRDFTDDSLQAMLTIARVAALAIEVADHAHEMVDVAVHEERQKLALTLHDSVGAMLFSIGAAVRDLGSTAECPPTVCTRLTYVEQQVAKTAAQLRQALRVFHEVPQEMALGVTLRAECRAFEQRTGIQSTCVIFEGLPQIEGETAKILLLAVREALLNAAKHSQATMLAVSLQAQDGGLNLVVADDGIGVQSDPGQAPGLGLRSTVERVNQIGGRVAFANNEDGGFALRVWVPC